MLTNTSPSHNEDCMMVKTSLLNKLPARKSKEVFIFQLHRHINGTLNTCLPASQAAFGSKPGSSFPQHLDLMILPCLSSLSNHSKTQQSHGKESIPYLNTLKSNPNLQI